MAPNVSDGTPAVGTFEPPPTGKLIRWWREQCLLSGEKRATFARCGASAYDHIGRIEIQHCGDMLSRIPLAGCNSVRREFIMTPTRA
jgi:hypothetical protein